MSAENKKRVRLNGQSNDKKTNEKKQIVVKSKKIINNNFENDDITNNSEEIKKIKCKKWQDEINKLMETDENPPDLNDPMWEKMSVKNSKVPIYKYKDKLDIEFLITDDMIYNAKLYNELRNNIINNGGKEQFHIDEIPVEEKIYRIIMFYDEDTSFVTYSSVSMLFCVISNISQSLLKKENAKISIFKNLENVKCKLLEYYRGTSVYCNSIIKTYNEDTNMKTAVNTLYYNVMRINITDEIKNRIAAKKYYVQSWT